MELPEVQELLADVNLPKGYSAQEFMYTLNDNGDDELTYSECTRNLFRLLDNDPFQRSCMMTGTLNELRSHILHIRKEMPTQSCMEETRQALLQLHVVATADRLQL